MKMRGCLGELPGSGDYYLVLRHGLWDFCMLGVYDYIG